MHSETDVHKFQWPELATIPKPVNKVCMHACTITNTHMRSCQMCHLEVRCEKGCVCMCVCVCVCVRTSSVCVDMLATFGVWVYTFTCICTNGLLHNGYNGCVSS